MSSRVRAVLALIGIILILLAVAALAYALWPRETVSEQFRLAPTLFAPPQSFMFPPRFE